jgi:predicted DNA-binding transcriptional regulator AlpA
MAHPIPPNLPPRMLRTPEAARFLGLSARTMEKHRMYGTGPRYRKIGGRVLYTVEDLQGWADQGIAESTSDPNAFVIKAPRPHNADLSRAPARAGKLA